MGSESVKLDSYGRDHDEAQLGAGGRRRRAPLCKQLVCGYEQSDTRKAQMPESPNNDFVVDEHNSHLYRAFQVRVHDSLIL